jgi:Flp pilus assembly protein protease CpaA
MVGGGDVKLLAAIGAWVGLSFSLFWVWMGSVLVLLLWTLARVLRQAFSPRGLRRTVEALKNPAGRPGDKKPPRVRVTYSVPIAVATILVLLWMHRVELLLVPPKPQPDRPQGAIAHVRPTPELV